MKKITFSAIVAAAALTVAAPAFANDQLARSLGVEPGALTTSQLIQLQSALSSDDHIRAFHLMRIADGATVGVERTRAAVAGSDVAGPASNVLALQSPGPIT